MEGAGEGIEHPAIGLTQTISAMLAKVVEAANLVVVAFHKQKRLFAELVHVEGTWLREVVHPGHQLPGLGPDLVPLGLHELRREVSLAIEPFQAQVDIANTGNKRRRVKRPFRPLRPFKYVPFDLRHAYIPDPEFFVPILSLSCAKVHLQCATCACTGPYPSRPEVEARG